jgi:mannose-1-phosphate guanylyltransferase/mannose-6-phosphate isomerase
MRVVPVVLSGGSGTRLWPLSTPERPKQLHALVGDQPMLVETIRRLDGLDVGPPIVVCGAAHADGVREVLEGIDATIVVEPVGRNTAPAIAVAARMSDPDDVLVVLPADHVIRDGEAFRSAMGTAVELASSGHLVTFGVVATKPATGYGWIEPGAEVDGATRVASFREKPDAGTAEEYLAAGWLWNSGMFCFTAGAYLEELELHRPDVAAAVSVDLAGYAEVPSESIDYAVMEPTDRAVVVPLDAGWSDVGSWASLWEALDKDEAGNAVVGKAFVEGTTGSLVVSEGQPIAVIGQRDVAVVAGAHGVAVIPLAASERVRQASQAFDG